MTEPPRLLTNHARVLLCIARDCDIRVRDIAIQVGITERAAHRAVADLVGSGLISRSRNGRRNCYELLVPPGDGAELERLRELGELVPAPAASPR